ncbi:MAG: hypothetical protein DRP47_01170 [Candidatus Zixiibacteriota bacterium]|nr:MAG: hypothetical protein DRP47_01170 [candidate division Zixibacteria bacterium]
MEFSVKILVQREYITMPLYRQGSAQSWHAKCEKCSPRYTSDWKELVNIIAD